MISWLGFGVLVGVLSFVVLMLAIIIVHITEIDRS